MISQLELIAHRRLGMTKNWKTWLVAGSASLGALFAGVQMLGTDEEGKPSRPDSGPALHGGVASNPFIVSNIPHAEEKAEIAHSGTSAPVIQKSPRKESEERMEREARFFLDKYAKATTAAGKFDNIVFVLSGLGNDIKNAHLIGMQPAQLARLVRDHACQALPEIQGQTPVTDLERFIKANLTRIAVQNMALMDDGSYNDEYAAQMSGVDTHKNDNEKISLAYSAAKQAVAILLTAHDPRSMSYEQLSSYQDLVNIVKYVEFSDELRQDDRLTVDRLEKIGITYEQLAELKEKIFEPLNNEVNRRIAESAQQQASPVPQHPMLPRNIPS